MLAVTGDEVNVERTGMAVNGRAVEGSRAMPCDSAGRALPHTPFGRPRVRAERGLAVRALPSAIVHDHHRDQLASHRLFRYWPERAGS